MIRHYPATHEAVEPSLEWPGAAEIDQPTRELVWLAQNEPDTWPDGLRDVSLAPAGEAVDGEPEEGTISGSGTFVPVWMCTRGKSWWAVEATTGQVIKGQLEAVVHTARGRLVFFAGLALILTFLGGSIFFWLLSMIVATSKFVVPDGAGMAVVFAGTLVAVLWLMFRLSVAIPAALVEPVNRVQTGTISLPLTHEWRGLLHAASLCLGVVGGLSLLTCVMLSFAGRGLAPLLFGLCQTALAVFLSRACWQLAHGRQLRDLSDRPLTGRLGELVLMGVRVALFGLAGQLVGGLLAMCQIGHVDANQAMLMGAELGALAGVASAEISLRARVAIFAGLAGRSLGPWLGGPLVGLLLALVGVASPGLVMLVKQGRKENLPVVLRQAWAFVFGMVGGRLVGRVFGLFFLGAGGIAVGEVLAEQVAGTMGLMSQTDPSE